MDFVRPIKITSPISGQSSTPRIVERRVGKNIHKEAHWYDPACGTFLQKGLVSIEEVKDEKSS